MRKGINILKYNIQDFYDYFILVDSVRKYFGIKYNPNGVKNRDTGDYILVMS